MRTLLIILAILLLVSLGLNAWTLSQLTSVKKELRDQSNKVSNLINDVNNLKNDSGKEKSRPSPDQKVMVAFDNDPVKGDPNAPVTIVEFSDYQCPFCRRFHKEVLPKIQQEYISTGKVRYIFRDFPLSFHKNAMPAAVSANCAGEQGKYWVMNEFLFNNPSKLDTDSILASVKGLGLDYDKFSNCVMNEESKQEAEINSDMQAGRNYGVKGTPSLFIGRTGNGNQMEALYLRGLRPFSSIKPTIENLLNSK